MATCKCGQDPHLPTCPEFSGVRGIDDKRRLLGFFAKKGHYNLVLRVVDVLDLKPTNQARVMGMVAINRNGELPTEPPKNLKTWLLREFPGGYITIPINKLLDPLPLEQVSIVQEVIAEYRDVRMGKGSPSKTEPCPKCGGTGFGVTGSGKCSHCDGSGRLVIFLEMDDYEVELAEKEV